MKKPAKKESTPDFHQSYLPLKEAIESIGPSHVFVPIPTIWPPRLMGFPAKLKRVWEMFFSILTHIRLVSRLWKFRFAELIIVREFLNIPLLLVWPILYPLHKRIVFLVNHNIQYANTKRSERFALRLLTGAGARLLCLELPAGLAEIGLKGAAEKSLILPFPLGSGTFPAHAPTLSGRPSRVGVIGNFRPEKNVDPLLESLVAAVQRGQVNVEVVLGCPDLAYRKIWESRGVTVIDTTDYADYEAAMNTCEVIVLNYEKASYYFRHSGVIADAVSRGVSVVCPNFPLLRHQVESPFPVGTTFDHIDELPLRLGEALLLNYARNTHAFREHKRVRSASEIAKLLKLELQNVTRRIL